MQITISDEIKHLSSEQIEELYQRYLEGEKNQTLIDEYGIDCRPSNLIRLLPPMLQEGVTCKTCNIPMYRKRRTKSGEPSPYAYFCISCGHLSPLNNRFLSTYCNCDACKQEEENSRLEIERQRRDKVVSYFGTDRLKLVPYSSLNFMEKCVLLSIFQLQEGYQRDGVAPLHLFTERLSPTKEMDEKILEALFNSNIIRVDPLSELYAFNISDESITFYFDLVSWELNVANQSGEKFTLEELYNELKGEEFAILPEDEKSMLKEFMFTLAESELERFLNCRLDSFGLSSAPNKVQLSLRTLLNNFSVSQGFYLCYLAARRAHDFYSRGAKSKKHAVNILPNTLLDLNNRALSESWNIKGYKRGYETEDTYVSKVFYQIMSPEVLDAGFHEDLKSIWSEIELSKFPPEVIDEDIFLCPACESKDYSFKGDLYLLKLLCNCCAFEANFTQISREVKERRT